MNSGVTPALTQALIFDMDGTMVDSMPHHAQSWLAFGKKHKLNLSLDEMMQRTTGRNGLECVRVLLDDPSLDESTAWAMVHEKEILYREMYGPILKEVAGFKQFMTQARTHGLKIGVGTAGDIHNVNFVLQHLQLPTEPDAIARGDEGLTGKPTPAIFLEAAKRIKIPAENCIVFEDAPFGIEAARRAGMRAVAICTGHSAHELAGPHVIAAAANYHELLESNFLENLNVAA
ncbi:MAG TPA: HAD family phosphatase [Burkholderiaceae bacterium]|nr:HAD family phosphatase [Burkholderiaceae bacterium]